MLYSTRSPYYRQFLSSAVNKKYQKNLEKAQGTQPVAENRGNVNPSSVGMWSQSPINFSCIGIAFFLIFSLQAAISDIKLLFQTAININREGFAQKNMSKL